MPQKNKLLLIGWDAADWDIIWPLVNAGKMPALKSLIARGTHGNISTMNPPYSPMLWTSVATGKTPDKHGVLGFIEVTPEGQSVRPVTTLSRKTRALWNIFHNQGMRSNLVGWWPSFPAEPINGYVISDRFQKTHMDPRLQTPMSPKSIHPWDKHEDFRGLRMFPFEITKAHLLPFVPQADIVDQDKHKGLNAIAKIVSENSSLHNAATRLLRTTEWDFMAVYYDMIDHFCHSFMKYHPPKHPGVDPQNHDIFKEAVTGAYLFQDMMLERTLKLVDDQTTIIVMSDHGFESGDKRILNMPKVQAAPSLEHRQFGMFVACGPNIKKNEKVYGLGIIDIGPTVLHHFGLPVGKDMDGHVNLDIFENPKPVQYIDSWDAVSGDFGELDNTQETDAFSDQQTMEQLIELGYVEKLDEKFEVAIRNTRIDLKHNLARVHMGKKDLAAAKEILLALLDEPQAKDYAPFYMDLIGISLKERNFEAALEYLQCVKTSGTEVKYNLDLTEAQILSDIGRPREALVLIEHLLQTDQTGPVWYRYGLLHYQLGALAQAKEAFENAIERDSQIPGYHAALAEVYLQLDDYEEAAEYALTSVELVKYFPKGHLLLGQALEKLGDLENAKVAFEMAAKLKPKEFPQAQQSIENLEQRIDLGIEYEDKVTNKHYDNQIVVVSGLPRSGTSLMMQMMDKAGIVALTDELREADVSNPKGYYEYEPVKALYKDNSWLDKAQNKSVKIVAPLLKYLDNKHRYKIIFMKRDLDEVVQSQQKMLGKSEATFPIKIYNQFQRLLASVAAWQKLAPGIEILYLDYKDVVAQPDKIAEQIQEFVGVPLDQEAMTQVVDPTLYRNKNKNSPQA
ncbi:MAG: alkaline phosphatase family protein [Flavobacteriaceae bacterium]|nr:alkaline phosphatase family protein [Flavobacteriaceae bacterium]MDG1962180.1 alkaline phosphatase family protein [Flavobacteriaceae bacterium]